jgi:hypothetical protein
VPDGTVVVVVDFACADAFGWLIGEEGFARTRISEFPPGDVDDKGVDIRGKEMLGIDGVASEGSDRFGISWWALGVAVDGVTNEGSERFGASLDTLGSDDDAGDTKSGSEIFGTSWLALGVAVDGVTSEGSDKFCANPDTLGSEDAAGATKSGSERFGTNWFTLGAGEDAAGKTKSERPIALNGAAIDSAVVNGKPTAGTLTLDPELAFVPTGEIASLRGTTPTRPDTNPDASPTWAEGTARSGAAIALKGIRGSTVGTEEVAAQVHVVVAPEGIVDVLPEGTTVVARDATVPTVALTPARTRGNVTVLASRLTRPVSDWARPSSDVPRPRVMSWSAKIVPTSEVEGASVAAPPTCQSTFPACAPPFRDTTALAAVTKLPGIWKTKSPLRWPSASRVTRPPSDNEPGQA